MMTQPKNAVHAMWPALLTAGLVLILPLPAPGQAGLGPGSAQPAPARELRLTVGRGELLQFAREVTKISISEPAIADAVKDALDPQHRFPSLDE